MGPKSAIYTRKRNKKHPQPYRVRVFTMPSFVFRVIEFQSAIPSLQLLKYALWKQARCFLSSIIYKKKDNRKSCWTCHESKRLFKIMIKVQSWKITAPYHTDCKLGPRHTSLFQHSDFKIYCSFIPAFQVKRRYAIANKKVSPVNHRSKRTFRQTDVSVIIFREPRRVQSSLSLIDCCYWGTTKHDVYSTLMILF